MQTQSTTGGCLSSHHPGHMCAPKYIVIRKINFKQNLLTSNRMTLFFQSCSFSNNLKSQISIKCSIEIREPTESVLIGQRIWLDCYLQGQWQELIGCTLNGQKYTIHSSVSTNQCQLDITANTVGTNLVQCTVLCSDGSTSNRAISMTVAGRCVHAHTYIHVNS